MHRRLAPGGGGGEQRVGDGLVGGQAGDDLDQRHQRCRVEEVQAGQAFRVFQRGADGGHRDRRGVGAEDAVLADDGFEVGVELLFGFQVLDDGLDDQRRIGEVGQAAGRDQVLPGRFSCCCGQLAFFGHFRELGTNTGDSAIRRIGAGVEQLDPVAGGGRHLGDAGAHGAGADDGDDRLLGKGAVAHAITLR